MITRPLPYSIEEMTNAGIVTLSIAIVFFGYIISQDRSQNAASEDVRSLGG